MTGVGTGGKVWNLVEAVRVRVRVRTRLRRVLQAGRQAVPRRLPAWSDPAPARVGASQPGQLELTAESAGAVRRYAAGTGSEPTTGSLRLVVTEWRAPYPGWRGRLGPLPGLVSHDVCLPESGRGRATVTVGLAEPLPVGRILTAARPVLEPVHAPVPAGDARIGTVDATTAHPRGRDRYGPRLPAGRLVLVPGPAGGRWEIARVPDGTPVVAGRVGDPLDDRQRGVLAKLGSVSFAGGDGLPRAAQTQVLAQLAMTGVLLHCPALADGLLTPELVGVVRAALPDRRADPLAWETRSVRQRRAAMRGHAAGLAPGAGGTGPPPVSAVLVTKRPHLVAPAVATLAAQTYPELEIVVGLHGGDLPAGGDPLPGPMVTIPAGRNLGEALAETTRAAGGRLVTKIDDDDRYGPEHIWDVVLAWHYSGATVTGKGSEFVYLEPKDLTVRRRMGAEFFTDTVAGGTLTLARTDLDAAGGWPPVPRWVDRALLDRVLAAGGLVYRTHPFGFIYTRHGDGHTWDADLASFQRDPLRKWRGLPAEPEFGTA